MTNPIPHTERHIIPNGATSGTVPIQMRQGVPVVHTRIEVVPATSGTYQAEAVMYTNNHSEEYITRYFTVVNTNQNVGNGFLPEAKYIGPLDLANFSLHVYEVFPAT